MGADTVDADAEMLAMVVDGLKKVGLKEFQVTVGHVDFLRSLMKETGLDEETTREVLTLINNRNYYGVEEILDNAGVEEEIKKVFRTLPELVGGCEVLDLALALGAKEKAREAILRLKEIYRVLEYYGVQDSISFDLSMNGSYMYYTGIIFRAYTYGTGDAVVRGGRYDHLLEKFGKVTPSIGFAIIIDELTSALSRQKITVETQRANLIVYTEKTLKWAVSLAKDFREKKMNVELLKREPAEAKEEYLAYGKRIHASVMFYLKEDASIEVINLDTDEEKLVKSKKKNEN